MRLPSRALAWGPRLGRAPLPTTPLAPPLPDPPRAASALVDGVDAGHRRDPKKVSPDSSEQATSAADGRTSSDAPPRDTSVTAGHPLGLFSRQGSSGEDPPAAGAPGPADPANSHAASLVPPDPQPPPVSASSLCAVGPPPSPRGSFGPRPVEVQELELDSTGPLADRPSPTHTSPPSPRANAARSDPSLETIGVPLPTIDTLCVMSRVLDPVLVSSGASSVNASGTASPSGATSPGMPVLTETCVANGQMTSRRQRLNGRRRTERPPRSRSASRARARRSLRTRSHGPLPHFVPPAVLVRILPAPPTILTVAGPLAGAEPEGASSARLNVAPLSPLRLTVDSTTPAPLPEPGTLTFPQGPPAAGLAEPTPASDLLQSAGGGRRPELVVRVTRAAPATDAPTSAMLGRLRLRPDFYRFSRRVGLLLAVVCSVWAVDIHGAVGWYTVGTTDVLVTAADSLFMALISLWLHLNTLSIYRRLGGHYPSGLRFLLASLPPLFLVLGWACNVVGIVTQLVLSRAVFDLLLATLIFFYLGCVLWIHRSLRDQLTTYREAVLSVAARLAHARQLGPSASAEAGGGSDARHSTLVRMHGRTIRFHRFLYVMVPCAILIMTLMSYQGVVYLLQSLDADEQKRRLPPAPSTLEEILIVMSFDLAGWIMIAYLAWISFPRESPVADTPDLCTPTSGGAAPPLPPWHPDAKLAVPERKAAKHGEESNAPARSPRPVQSRGAEGTFLTVPTEAGAAASPSRLRRARTAHQWSVNRPDQPDPPREVLRAPPTRPAVIIVARDSSPFAQELQPLPESDFGLSRVSEGRESVLASSVRWPVGPLRSSAIAEASSIRGSAAGHFPGAEPAPLALAIRIH